MFKKLRNKFLILNMSITSLVMITAFAIVYLSTYNNIQTENQKKLKGLNKQIAVINNDLPPLPGGPSTHQEMGMSQIISSDYSPSFTIEVDKNGNVSRISSFIDMPQEDYYKAAQTALNHREESTTKIEGKLWQYAITPASKYIISNNGVKAVLDGTEDGYQIAFLNVTDAHKTLRDLLITLVFVTIVMLAVIFFISLYFANRSIKPISEAWQKQRQFVADASHELKTPLTIINANYDALLSNKEETIESQIKWFDYMKIGTDRMGKLINDLLALTKMEDINIEISKTPFVLSETIQGVIMSMDAAAHEKKLALSQNIQSDITLVSDMEMVKQVFTILYDNAIKYSNENGQIEVSLRKVKHRILCTVKNSGKGIEKKDLPRIFDRFYRADPSRTGEKGGYGLGLPIAKSIISRLGGEIWVESEVNKWTTFTFAFME